VARAGGDPAGLHRLAGGLPDVAYTVEDQVAEGDNVVSRYRGEGTHLGDWRGVSVTGRCFSYTSILIHRCAAGRIADNTGLSIWPDPPILACADATISA